MKSTMNEMLAKLVKIDMNGEQELKIDEVGSYEEAFRMLEDYILDAIDIDDFIKEKYAAFAAGEDERGRKQRIRWLQKNGQIHECSLRGGYDIELRVYEEDPGLDDTEYAESCMCNERRLSNDEIMMYAVQPEKRKMVKKLYGDVVRGHPDAYGKLVELLGDKAADLQENLRWLKRDAEVEKHKAATISDWYARSAHSGSNMGD